MSADQLLAWLVQSTQPGASVVRERYVFSSNSWVPLIRPDCNVETMLAYLLKWQQSSDTAWLTRSRAIWDEISPYQGVTGPWPFSTGANAGRWYNDNSEVVIFLLKCAEIDTARTTTYRASALLTVDNLLANQRADGAWPSGEGNTVHAPMWVGHVIAALASAYAYTDTAKKAQIRVAIEEGIAWLGTQVTGGRVITSFEVNGVDEAWRPPSSDQSICIRGIALAERLVPSTFTGSWTSLRHSLHGWLDPLLDSSSGAMKNGYGLGVTEADVARITDNVYTNPFAAAAYRESYRVDSNPVYAQAADGVVAFMDSIIWTSVNPDANGCLRGAYDLVSQDFDTSEIPQNSNEEGGGNMAYTGWSAAPAVVLMLEPPPTTTTTTTGTTTTTTTTAGGGLTSGQKAAMLL